MRSRRDSLQIAAMRYVDTGRRHPAEALGNWLKSAIELDSTVQALRWQTGFFNAAPLSLLKPAMARIAQADGILRLLIGSNDGCTSRADIEHLLVTSGPARKKRQIGIINFSNAYFHPKTIHIVRADGSEASYVGSANLTAPGVNGLHVEAGLILDTHDGDDAAVLAKIRQAIDWWFLNARPGLHPISKSSDLDALVKGGILDVPPPVPAPGAASKTTKAASAKLQPLLELASIPKPSPISSTKATTTASPISGVAQQWIKKLSASDAQRKATGNQRGSITLVNAGHPINASTYFKDIFFKSASWTKKTTVTGKPLQICVVPFKVDFLGVNLGILDIEISHEKGRESQQSNYTSLLHLGPVLSAEFKNQNVTGRFIRLVRSAGGAYALSILKSAP